MDKLTVKDIARMDMGTYAKHRRELLAIANNRHNSFVRMVAGLRTEDSVIRTVRRTRDQIVHRLLNGATFAEANRLIDELTR
jgi:hypothetical protein